jgi:hypothetical protein
MIRVALTGALALLFLMAGSAEAANPPAVVSESVSGITSTDATLEASLESGSAPAGAYYQFQISEFPAEFPDELNCPPPPSSGPFLPCNGPESSTALPIGHIQQSDGQTTVSLDLADAGLSLQPGTTYYFRAVVASAVESEDTIEWEGPVVGGAEHSFTTSEPSSSPLVTGESVSQLTSTNATLEAAIDSNGAATYYQFQFSEFPAEFPDELSCPPPPVLGLPACVGPQSSDALPIGYVAGEGGTTNVALTLADAGVALRPGATYYFRVVAATAKQTEDSVEWETPVAAGAVHAFTTPVAAGGSGEGSAGGAATSGAVLTPADTPPQHHRRHHRRHARHLQGAQALSLARIAR